MRRSLLVSSILALLAAVAAPATVLAVAPVDPGSKAQSFTQVVPLPRTDCQARAELDPNEADLILDHCYVTVTGTMSPLYKIAGAPSGQQQAMATTCDLWRWTIGELTFNSFPNYSVKVTAKAEIDSCNNVQWDWVTCNASWLWPFTVSVTWCGAYPGTGRFYYYTGTNVGINYTASTPIGGSTKGARWGIRPTYPTSAVYYNVFSW